MSEQDDQELLPLRGKQPMFCLMFVSDANFNATLAARLAGYAGNYTTLATTGYENLQKPHIKAEIERLLETRVMQKNEVLARLSDMARGPGDYILPDGTVDIERLVEDGKGHIIHEVRETLTRKAGSKDETLINRTFRFYDSRRALVDVGKHLQLFVERHKHEGEVKHIHRGFNEAVDSIYGDDKEGEPTEP